MWHDESAKVLQPLEEDFENGEIKLIKLSEIIEGKFSLEIKPHTPCLFKLSLTFKKDLNFLYQ